MIASLLLAALAASVAPTHEKSETIQNRRFYAIGWLFDGRRCQSSPREFGPNLVFKVTPSNAGFDRAKKLGQSWGVVLECAIVVDRLVKCKVADDTVGSEEGRGVALGLVSFFRLQAGNPLSPTQSSTSYMRQATAQVGCAPSHRRPYQYRWHLRPLDNAAEHLSKLMQKSALMRRAYVRSRPQSDTRSIISCRAMVPTTEGGGR
jgi:hypothetical protein